MNKFLKDAHSKRQLVSNLLRDLIRIPSLSTQEEAVAQRLVLEARAVGADEVFIDEHGTFIARFGLGPRVIIYDSHIDTVDVGSRSEWGRDPFEPWIERKASGNIIHGRGASDNKAGIASMLIGASQWKTFTAKGGFSIYVVGSVQEEACDGLALYHVLTSQRIPNPEVVVLGEATTCKVFRGNRGRIEAYLRVHGQSCHASAPERGVNPVTSIVPLIEEIHRLNNRMESSTFLGKGSIAITKIECETPSLNAVPSSATLFVDRRLSQDDTPESALAELRDIAQALNIAADIDLLEYEAISYTGSKVNQRKEFNTWVLDEGSDFLKAAISTTEVTSRPSTETSHWIFSTNGVASMGKLGIPTIGYGPGNEIHAHTAHDQCPEDDLVEAVAWFSAFPEILENSGRS